MTSKIEKYTKISNLVLTDININDQNNVNIFVSSIF